MTTQPQGSALLSVEEAATYLGLSASTLNKKRLTGDGPAYLKLSRKCSYAVADLDLFIASKRRRSTSEQTAGGVA